VSGQRIEVVRADDLLVCGLEFDGIEVTGTAANRRLEAKAGAANTRIVLHIPPQHIAEETFSGSISHDRLAGSRAAAPSRVAFDVPASALPVPYTLTAILELLSSCRLALARSARRPPEGWLAALFFWLSPPVLAEPDATETAIELPFRLILSPDELATFDHPADAPAGPRIPLWHTRLTSPDLRAIWLRQGDGPPWHPTVPRWPEEDLGEGEPFRGNAMSQRNRHDIVHLSGNASYARQSGTGYFPRPIGVQRLALSSLGAWLTSRGAWDPPLQVTPLLEWAHRATQGRDHSVRIVEAGFLYPFGHAAALVQITERQFAGDRAVLRTRQFVVVRQPVREFQPATAPAGLAHTMPLRTIELRTLVTPDLAVPNGSTCFLVIPQGSADPLPFKLTGTDVEGNTLDLLSPLAFILSTSAHDASVIRTAQSLYSGAHGHELAASGAALALAPGPKGDTTYPAQTVVFDAPAAVVAAADQPGFWPQLTRADVAAPALQILGVPDLPTSLSYHEAFIKNGLGGDNRGELIAKLVSAAVPLRFGEHVGGLIQPSMTVAGLSRQLGAVGGLGALTEIAAGTFDPKNFFAGASSKLFGVFTLEEVIARLTGAAPKDMPRVVTEGEGDTLTAHVRWNPIPQSFPPAPDSWFVVSSATRMEVTATIVPRGPEPRADVTARLTNFALHLLPPDRFIELDFERLEFVAKTGRKPDVDVVLGRIRFVGPLSFVEELKSLIPLDAFSDPPALDITPAGIRSSFSLALPNLAVGVFSLQNINLGGGFAIPFLGGAMTVSFNFCTRAEPFLLTVSGFGGGGFFGVAIDGRGLQMLEASLEFGASVAIDLGVAQGGVHVMAGIYFKMETDQGVTLTGYLRLGGCVSVLGLISVSIELVLSFTYQGPDPGKAVGRATLTIEIDIFMFSQSVEIECERKFAGSSNDPPFEALMGPDAWRTYCEAYA
jgi:hypothetical protein